MCGVYFTVLYLQRLEKLRTGENWGACTFCPTKKEFQLIFPPLTYRGKKKVHGHTFISFSSANREKDLKKTKQIEIQTNAMCAYTFL